MLWIIAWLEASREAAVEAAVPFLVTTGDNSNASTRPGLGHGAYQRIAIRQATYRQFGWLRAFGLASSTTGTCCDY